MAKIVLSVAGEGRGHAARARTVVEHLRREHCMILLAPSVAYDLLAAAYAETPRVTVHRIPGLHFCYREQKLDYLKTVAASIPYLRRVSDSVSWIEDLLRRERPALVITDFEPLLPRAAGRCGLPYVSLDHQHFLVTHDLSQLPRWQRWKAWFVGLPIPLFYRRQRRTIVSSFYRAPLKRSARRVVQTGVLLRPEILAARPVVGEHILVYLRRFVRPEVIESLQNSGREVRVYGLGKRSPEGNCRFHDVDEVNFLRDLSACYAVLSSAGNQLVGEAMYLRKPLLALPETGNFEQAINAHFVRKVAAGDWVDCDRFRQSDLERFLERVPEFRERICPEEVVGNDAVLDLIREELASAQAVPSPQTAVKAA